MQVLPHPSRFSVYATVSTHFPPLENDYFTSCYLGKKTSHLLFLGQNFPSLWLVLSVLAKQHITHASLLSVADIAPFTPSLHCSQQPMLCLHKLVLTSRYPKSILPLFPPPPSPSLPPPPPPPLPLLLSLSLCLSSLDVTPKHLWLQNILISHY